MQTRRKSSDPTFGGLPRGLFLGGSAPSVEGPALEGPADSATIVFLFLLPRGRPLFRFCGDSVVLAVASGDGQNIYGQGWDKENRIQGGQFTRRLIYKPRRGKAERCDLSAHTCVWFAARVLWLINFGVLAQIFVFLRA